MLFKKELIDKILNGQKTATRQMKKQAEVGAILSARALGLEYLILRCRE